VAKAKGTNLLSAVKFLRRHREAARAALPPALHHYLEERVLPTSWYPEEDLIALLRVMAPMIGEGGDGAFELMGRLTVREHTEGVYERLLKGGDPLNVARRASALWQSQHDTGRLTLCDPAPGRARFELADYGHPTREMCVVVTGYIREALTGSGFAELAIRKTRCTVNGDRTCVWECTWREAPAG
jgi:hypothetical protein